MVNLPNIITGVRFFGAPILVYFYIQGRFTLAFWGMVCLGLTDWLDGFFARKFHQESLFGKIFDPIADKTLMITMFVTLGYLNTLPLGFVLLCLLRDFFLIIGGCIILKNSVTQNISPTKASKINTALQILVILVVTYRLQRLEVSSVFLLAENCLIILTSLFTFASGMQYAKTFWRFLKNT